MKSKYLHFFLLSLLIFFISGCTSTNINDSVNQKIYYKNQLTGEKILIYEWKYMGFGKLLPEWVVPALENNVNKVKNTDNILDNSEILILQALGYNLDQAESSLMEKAKPKDYELYDNFWVRIDNKDKMYISIAVYYKSLSN